MKRLGNFEIGELLGDGGMSVVWGGRHLVLGTHVAIKVLRAEFAHRELHRAAFFAEARSHAKLVHPGILRILDVGEVDEVGAEALKGIRPGAPFIAMERATGTLADDMPLRGWNAVYRVLLEILDALAHAHARGVIHRDLKPGNVMRVELEHGTRYRLGDFGLAHGRESPEERSVAMGPTAGTPNYMAPEQINGLWRDFAPETDLYALGCVAYELTCGSPPFDGDTLFQIVTGHTSRPPPAMELSFAVPDGFEGWVLRLLEKEPRDRYRRAADTAQALRAIADGFRDPMDSVIDLPTPVWTLGDATLVDLVLEPLDSGEAPAARARGAAGDGLGLFDLTEVPLVGRQSESKQLRAALLRAREHRGASVVVLRGPGGVGLSRLARSFATRMDELGLAFVHEATHTPVQAAHEGLSGLLETHFGTWDLEGDELRARVCEQLESEHVALQDDVAGAVVEIVGRAPQEVSAYRTSRERSALADSALRIGHEDRPRLYFFDDVQWGRESLEFVRDRVEADAQAVFVLTVRDDALSNTFADAVLRKLAAGPNSAVIQLSAPTTDDVQQFLHSLLEFAPTTASKIAQASADDFRFARHLVGHLLDVNALRMRTDGFELHHSARLPQSWDDLWAARLAVVLEACELEDGALWGLELAAELGRYPEQGELADALLAAGLAIDPRVHELLAKKGMVLMRHGAWTFALQSLVEHLRLRARASGRVASLSRACVAAIASRAPSRDRASRQAWHLLQAGELEKAFEPMQAAIRGYTAVDPDRADELLQWWNQTADALGLAKDATHRIDGLLMRASVSHTRGQVERHGRQLKKALRHARRVGYDEGEAWALLRTGQVAMDDGDLDFALDRFRRAESKFRNVGVHEGRASALFGAAFAMMRLGAAEASISDYRAAIEIYETIGNVESAVKVMSYLAYSYLVRGDYDAAEQLSRRAIDDARRLGDRTLEFESMSTLGEIARFRGRYAEARDYLQEVVQWRQTLGLRDAVVSEYNLALVELGAGNFGLAAEMFSRCEAAVIARGLEGRLPLVLLALAITALGKGDLATWEHFWQRFAPTLDDPTFVHIDVLWAAELGRGYAEAAGLEMELGLLDAVAVEQRARLA